jgi:hypothetical protein
VPDEPNATVPTSGTATFDIQLIVVSGTIKPGKWIATAGFGGFDMVVDSSSTRITEFLIKFSDWRCGGVRHSGSIKLTYNQGLPIQDHCFEFELDLSTDPFEDEPLEINGCFNESGDQATGTWEARINRQICSGTWEAAPES